MLFILLATLTDAGLDAAVDEPDMFAAACAEISVPGVRLLTRYATLGGYDFVAVAEAADAESMARRAVTSVRNDSVSLRNHEASN